MRKEHFTSVANSDNSTNFIEKKQSWTHMFVQWFHVPRGTLGVKCRALSEPGVLVIELVAEAVQ